MFTIRFIKPVTFKDSDGTIMKHFAVGATTFASATTGHYFVTSWGGVYTDEAERVAS